MMKTNERIKRREDRLLRWETYLRRTRHVGFGLGLLVVIAPIAFAIADTHLSDDGPATILVGLCLLFWAYVAHLKVRHIETIKRNRQHVASASDLAVDHAPGHTASNSLAAK